MNKPKAIPTLKQHDVFEGVSEILRFPRKQEWDNKLITEADGYQIPCNWSNQDLDILLTQLHSSIKTRTINMSECKIIIAGACYLRTPGGLSPDDRLIHATNFGSVPLDLNPSGTSRTSSLTTLSPTDRAYGLFICGFLFRILSKPIENVNKSWNRVMETYLNFYPSGQAPKEWPKPQLKWLDILKHHFSCDKRAIQTALRLINNLEMSYTDVGGVELGLIRYLFVIPLSYTGMHAYKLFCDVKEKTGKETEWLVWRLRDQFFNDALKVIDEISRNWDMGGPNANPAFRYARVLGPNYFPELQTKSCPQLVYLLARILSLYDSSGSNSNPEQIVGLDITEKNKALLDKVASRFYNVCK